VTSLVWSSDSSKLYSASNKFACVLDSVSGIELHRFEHAQYLDALALSPKHNLLACVGDGGVAQLRDTESHEPLVLPFSQEYDKRLYCVSFSRDGRYLAHGGDNNKITLWMVENIAPELPLMPHIFLPGVRVMVSPRISAITYRATFFGLPNHLALLLLTAPLVLPSPPILYRRGACGTSSFPLDTDRQQSSPFLCSHVSCAVSFRGTQDHGPSQSSLEDQKSCTGQHLAVSCRRIKVRRKRMATPMLRLISHPQQQLSRLLQLLSCLLQQHRSRLCRGHSTSRHSLQHDLHKKKNMTTAVGGTFWLLPAASHAGLESLYLPFNLLPLDDVLTIVLCSNPLVCETPLKGFIGNNPLYLTHRILFMH